MTTARLEILNRVVCQPGSLFQIAMLRPSSALCLPTNSRWHETFCRNPSGSCSAGAKLRAELPKGRGREKEGLKHNAPCRCANTGTTLTRAPTQEATMAVHQRNTASSHAQEPPFTIARVALYARVS